MDGHFRRQDFQICLDRVSIATDLNPSRLIVVCVAHVDGTRQSVDEIQLRHANIRYTRIRRLKRCEEQVHVEGYYSGLKKKK